MSRGRKPKPTALKLAEGNPGKRRIAPEVKPDATGLPSCPAHLSQTAKNEWKRISGELHRLGLLTRVDRAALAAYCAAYGYWVEADGVVQRDGITIETDKGNLIAHPAVGIRNRSLELMHRYLVEFGLTPSSRVGLAGDGADAKPADPIENALRLAGAG